MDKVRIYYLSESEEAHVTMNKFVEKYSNLYIMKSSYSKEEALKDIDQLFPDIIFIDEETIDDDFIHFIHKLVLIDPYSGIIVSSDDDNVGKIRKLMLAGVKDFLVKPFSSAEFSNTIQEVYTNSKLLKSHITKNATRILNRAPKMITVFSTKGGVGKSTISTLLASGLSHILKEDTAIVDLDLQFGDVSLILDVKPKATITNVIEQINDISREDLRNQLTTHPMGIKILPSPINPEEEDFIDEHSLARLLKMLKEEFDYVIIDCPPSFTDQIIVALEQSDLILFITSQELNTLKNTKNGLKTLVDLGVNLDKVRVISNRYSEKSNVTLELMEDVLKHPIYRTLSSDYNRIVQFLNHGKPEFIFEGTGKIGKELKGIIKDLRIIHTVNKPFRKVSLWKKLKNWFNSKRRDR
jgi:pilus assembly protein CpaE